jgi:hypothetical protein
MVATSTYVWNWILTGFVIEENNEKEQGHDSHEQSYRNPFFEACIYQQVFTSIATI